MVLSIWSPLTFFASWWLLAGLVVGLVYVLVVRYAR